MTRLTYCLRTGRTVVALIAFVATASAALAQSYPTRPVKLLVGFTPGGGVDINARLLATRLSEQFGQQFIVENRPGAGTNIANEAVAKAVPDGYTLLFSSPSVAINMSLYKNPPYDALRDFVPVSVFSVSTNVLVVPASLPAKTLEELIELAHSRPGTLNYASAGSGATQHLAGELFKLRTGTQIVHIPYKGSAPALAALIAGEVQMGFVNPVAIGQHVKSGRLRALAVAGARRTDLMPEVPTMKEAGVEGVEVVLWYGVLAPSATPPTIVSALANAIATAAQTPAVRQRLTEQGAEPVGNTQTEFGRTFQEEVRRWAEVVAVSGARVD
jgi:tripartite-type tricarboxylate transporter receptor subunit TctC